MRAISVWYCAHCLSQCCYCLSSIFIAIVEAIIIIILNNIANSSVITQSCLPLRFPEARNIKRDWGRSFIIPVTIAIGVKIKKKYFPLQNYHNIFHRTIRQSGVCGVKLNSWSGAFFHFQWVIQFEALYKPHVRLFVNFISQILNYISRVLCISQTGVSWIGGLIFSKEGLVLKLSENGDLLNWGL